MSEHQSGKSPEGSHITVPTDGQGDSTSTELQGRSGSPVMQHSVTTDDGKTRQETQETRSDHHNVYQYQLQQSEHVSSEHRLTTTDDDQSSSAPLSTNKSDVYGNLLKNWDSFRHWYETAHAIQSSHTVPSTPNGTSTESQPLTMCTSTVGNAVPTGIFKNVATTSLFHHDPIIGSIDLSKPKKKQQKKKTMSQPCVRRVDKPPYTYAALITMALESFPSKVATLKEIRTKLGTMFPFFRGEYTGWRQSIRHALSDSKCFYKVGEPIMVENNPNFNWTVDWKFVKKATFKRQKTKGSENYKEYLFEELDVPQPQLCSEGNDRPITIVPNVSKKSSGTMRLPHVPCYIEQPDTTFTLDHTDDCLNAGRDSEERPRTASSSADSVSQPEIDADITCNALPSYITDLDRPSKRKYDSSDETSSQLNTKKPRLLELTPQIIKNVNQVSEPSYYSKYSDQSARRPQQTVHHTGKVVTSSRDGSSNARQNTIHHSQPQVNLAHTWNYPSYNYTNSHIAGSQQSYTYGTTQQPYVYGTSPYFYNHFTGRWQLYSTWNPNAYNYNQMYNHGNSMTYYGHSNPYGSMPFYGQGRHSLDTPIDLTGNDRSESAS